MPADTLVTRAPQHARNRLRAARRHFRAVDTALRRASTYAHPAGRIVRIETHISVVYLAGRYAYKIMKPVDFGFVDFTQPAARQRCCEAEIRLNRPFAASIYVGVEPLTRDARGCRLGRRDARARVVDHAVKMRRFDERMLFSNLLARGELLPADIDAAADHLVDSYRHAPRAPATRPYGTSAQLREVVLAPLDTLERAAHTAQRVRDAGLRAYCERAFERFGAHLDARRASGFVRACHGDLHLDNIVRHGRRALMFDCIEFSETLRWIDVASDFAFLYMDLLAHGRADLANRLFARYLETTGDYGCLPVLRLFVVYRALVRAMVAVLKGAPTLASTYLDLAIAQTRPQHPALLLCHGFSGSGKSAASRALAQLTGAIRLSSDTERKRARPFEPPDLRTLPADAYTPDAIAAQYGRLADHARMALVAGYTVIVDATFLARAARERFAALAGELRVPWLILDFDASPACLAQRVRARALGPRDASDAGEAVLAAQRAQAEPFSAQERASTIAFDTDVPLDAFTRRAYWEPLLAHAAFSGSR
ncbi:MAG TPA: AAA family ATPase [Paraburkholderia sp.]|jgi:aminoglycoside phosphotransferase family enzyme/predicted kinase|nr:AAA family ATPase [Paraburkholderia sp.]